MKQLFSKLTKVVLSVLFAAFAGLAMAADYTWTGGAGNNVLTDGGNWSPKLPTTSSWSDVGIIDGLPSGTVLSMGEDYTAPKLLITNTPSLQLDLAGHKLSFANNINYAWSLSDCELTVTDTVGGGTNVSVYTSAASSLGVNSKLIYDGVAYTQVPPPTFPEDRSAELVFKNGTTAVFGQNVDIGRPEVNSRIVVDNAKLSWVRNFAHKAQYITKGWTIVAQNNGTATCNGSCYLGSSDVNDPIRFVATSGGEISMLTVSWQNGGFEAYCTNATIQLNGGNATSTYSSFGKFVCVDGEMKGLLSVRANNEVRFSGMCAALPSLSFAADAQDNDILFTNAICSVYPINNLNTLGRGTNNTVRILDSELSSSSASTPLNLFTSCGSSPSENSVIEFSGRKASLVSRGQSGNVAISISQANGAVSEEERPHLRFKLPEGGFDDTPIRAEISNNIRWNANPVIEIVADGVKYGDEPTYHPLIGFGEGFSSDFDGTRNPTTAANIEHLNAISSAYLPNGAALVVDNGTRKSVGVLLPARIALTADCRSAMKTVTAQLAASRTTDGETHAVCGAADAGTDPSAWTRDVVVDLPAGATEGTVEVTLESGERFIRFYTVNGDGTLSWSAAFELPGAPTGATQAVSVGSTFTSFDFTLVSSGLDFPVADVAFAFAPSGEELPEPTTLRVSVGAGETFRHYLTGLQPSTTYAYRYVLTDGYGASGEVTGTWTTAADGVPGEGGTVTRLANGDFLHAFAAADGDVQFRLPDGVTSFRYLLVGGGGTGGPRENAGTGGGGAGGFLTGTEAAEPGTIFTVTVGKGGVGYNGVTPVSGGSAIAGINGGDTTLLKDGEAYLTAKGGGAGAGGKWQGGQAGGSGGGACWQGGAAGQGVEGQGNAGGALNASYASGAGGGGAGAEGGAMASNDGAAGGDGLESDITGESRWYAGGGGGGAATGAKGGAGGKGGGGTGTDASGRNEAMNGVDGTGGGGGGLYNNAPATTSEALAGGKGGDGVAYIRYTPASERPEVPVLNMLSVTPNAEREAEVEYDVTWSGTADGLVDVVAAYGFAGEALTMTNVIASGVIGRGSGIIPDLKPGADYRVVFFAVNGARKSADTFERSLRIPGPCAIAAADCTSDKTSFTVAGEVRPGLGETKLYLRWGFDGAALDHEELLQTYELGDDGTFSTTISAPQAGSTLHWQVVASNAHSCVTWGESDWGESTAAKARILTDTTTVDWTWQTAGAGDWQEAGNWSAKDKTGFPNTAGARALFTTATDGATATLQDDVTLKLLKTTGAKVTVDANGRQLTTAGITLALGPNDETPELTFENAVFGANVNPKFPETAGTGGQAKLIYRNSTATLAVGDWAQPAHSALIADGGSLNVSVNYSRREAGANKPDRLLAALNGARVTLGGFAHLGSDDPEQPHVLVAENGAWLYAGDGGNRTFLHANILVAVTNATLNMGGGGNRYAMGFADDSHFDLNGATLDCYWNLGHRSSAYVTGNCDFAGFGPQLMSNYSWNSGEDTARKGVFSSVGSEILVENARVTGANRLSYVYGTNSTIRIRDSVVAMNGQLNFAPNFGCGSQFIVDNSIVTNAAHWLDFDVQTNVPGSALVLCGEAPRYVVTGNGNGVSCELGTDAEQTNPAEIRFVLPREGFVEAPIQFRAGKNGRIRAHLPIRIDATGYRKLRRYTMPLISMDQGWGVKATAEDITANLPAGALPKGAKLVWVGNDLCLEMPSQGGFSVIVR